VTFPTPILLWPFSHPFAGWAIGALGMGGLIFLDKTKKKTDHRIEPEAVHSKRSVKRNHLEPETEYLINGKSASGNDYLAALHGLNANDKDAVSFSVSGRPDMNVYIRDSFEGNECTKRLIIWRYKEDGSIWQWKTDVQELEPVQGYIAAYLIGDMSWAEALSWEQISLVTSETWRRVLRLLIPGLIIIGLILLLKYVYK
jgi:hypothetical protein